MGSGSFFSFTLDSPSLIPFHNSEKASETTGTRCATAAALLVCERLTTGQLGALSSGSFRKN